MCDFGKVTASQNLFFCFVFICQIEIIIIHRLLVRIKGDNVQSPAEVIPALVWLVG